MPKTENKKTIETIFEKMTKYKKSPNGPLG